MKKDKLVVSQGKQRAAKLIGRVKSINEFLSEAIDASKETSFVQAIGKALPWAGAIGEAATETLPVIKFVAKVFENFTKINDPAELGYIACNLAYQQSLAAAVKEIGDPENSTNAISEAKAQLETIKTSDQLNILSFSFNSALQHEFVTEADLQIRAALRPLGYSEERLNKLTDRTHDKFVTNLKMLLSDGATKERFEPFTNFLLGGNQELQSYIALAEHAQYQKWLFEESPVLGKSPFALADIYIDTECGKLTWDQIRDQESKVGANQSDSREKVDPFSEKWGGRHSLLETVLGLIGTATLNFNDAIVIQGIAGAGKSSFTLRLCTELIKQGVHPIRVRLGDLRLDDRPILEDLAEAIKLTDDIRSRNQHIFKPEDLFLGSRIFKEPAQFRRARICRYILILDGWDEITIGSGQGFRTRVERMLERVRAEFLKNRDLPVRVILTGRPSIDIADSSFLHSKTPILTVRPFRPEQLEEFVSKLQKAIAGHRIHNDMIEVWPELNLDRFIPVFEQYKEVFKQVHSSQYESHRPYETRASNLDVMGLPLLALMASRLVSEWHGDSSSLVKNPTTLYRNLVNLTCGGSGKVHKDPSNPDGQYKISGSKLRSLLQKTATAMTIYGQENIPRGELELRLGWGEGGLDRHVSQTRDHSLSSLMISFYFKEGNPNFGCEFAHKSFREYLFAEAVVEVLKDFGRASESDLPEQVSYWKEFDESDPRYMFSRNLANLIAPHWLRPEVVNHVHNLIKWEFDRLKDRQAEAGISTGKLDLECWRKVRDGLADLWDWWGEGVHLRPQPFKDRYIKLKEPYVNELIKHSVPQYDTWHSHFMPIPARITTMDAHLGDGLFRLCALTHYYVAVNDGWSALPDSLTGSAKMRERWEGMSFIGSGPRRYQSSVKQNGRTLVFFAPSGKDTSYFRNYVARINGGGWRLDESFPSGTSLPAIDLRQANLVGANLVGANLVGANLDGANLVGANLDGANLDGANLDGANLVGAILVGARLTRANLVRANLIGARLDLAILDSASLVKARIQGASLDRASLDGASLDGASLDGAKLDSASLDGASLIGASLTGARLVSVSLVGANLDEAVLDRANLFAANLDRASLDRASLVGAILDNASLDRASFVEARLNGASIVEASLIGARLVEASMVGIKLDRAILNGAILNGAKLYRAWLSKQHLEFAKKSGATIRDIYLIDEPSIEE